MQTGRSKSFIHEQIIFSIIAHTENSEATPTDLQIMSPTEPQARLMILANEIIKLPPDTDKPVKLNPQTVACSEVSLKHMQDISSSITGNDSFIRRLTQSEFNAPQMFCI